MVGILAKVGYKNALKMVQRYRQCVMEEEFTTRTYINGDQEIDLHFFRLISIR